MKVIVSMLEKKSAAGGQIITASSPSCTTPRDNKSSGTIKYIGIKNITWRVSSSIADFIGWPLLWKYEPPTAWNPTRGKNVTYTINVIAENSSSSP